MKKTVTLMLTLTLLLCAAAAAADQKVTLPESRYSLTLPDALEYDGPGETPEDDAKFAYVSESLGLDIQFFRQENPGNATLQAMTDVLIAKNVDAAVYRIHGVDMIAYRVTDPGDPPEKGMKCVAYVLLDGEAAQMICFWYANQKAADLTEKIIQTITLDP